MDYNFFISKNATLPYLRMEPIYDGINDFSKLNIALQASTVYFTMKNIENGIITVANEKAEVLTINDDECGEKCILEYQWKERDTRKIGVYEGIFTILFDEDITMKDTIFPKGKLIVPISHKLFVHII